LEGRGLDGGIVGRRRDGAALEGIGTVDTAELERRAITAGGVRIGMGKEGMWR
jgi:hypothetical protein